MGRVDISSESWCDCGVRPLGFAWDKIVDCGLSGVERQILEQRVCEGYGFGIAASTSLRAPSIPSWFFACPPSLWRVSILIQPVSGQNHPYLADFPAFSLIPSSQQLFSRKIIS